MAEEQDSGQDKTEEPTEKRLTEARKEGQVPRSRELSTAAVFGAGVITMYALGGWMASSAGDVFRRAMTIDPGRVGDARMLPGHFGKVILELLLIISPISVICVIVGICAPALLGGFNFSAKAMAPKFSKLNPIAGLKRIYGPEGLAELARSILRVIVISSVFVAMMKLIVPRLIALMHQPLGVAAGEGFGMALLTLIAIAGGLGLIAAADIPFQLWTHRKKLKMTRQQVRDEMKETEGRPEVKQKIRQLQHEMAQGGMIEAIGKADVVLVNPTHYAVAIAYDAANMRAPKVVAKGVDEIAQTIRELAEHHKIPIVTSPPLARTLYRQVQIGREIPVNLYAAIAQVLSYVYQLRQWRQRGGEYPTLPEIALSDEPTGG